MPSSHPIGLVGLIEELALSIDPPAVRSEAGSVSRRTEEHLGDVLEVYPLQYDCRSLQEHLRFALRNEPIDLRVWQAVANGLPGDVIRTWVRKQPTSRYSRVAWYLIERLAGRRLDLADTGTAPYVDVASPTLQIVWNRKGWSAPHSRRHRVRNNLLGTKDYCPLVRRTRRIRDHQARKYGEQVRELTAEVDPVLFQQAADYLYLSETKSSYAIEGEKPSEGREERFVATLALAGEKDAASEETLVELQQQIIQDPRFAASGWRTVQNYVGRTRLDYSSSRSGPTLRPE